MISVTVKVLCSCVEGPVTSRWNWISIVCCPAVRGSVRNSTCPGNVYVPLEGGLGEDAL